MSLLSETARKCVRKPLRTPQFVANALLEAWPASPAGGVSDLRYRAISQFYNQHGNLSSLAGTIREMTSRYSDHAGSTPRQPSNRVALVLMLRGFGYPHAFHNYLVAHALKDLNYDVKLVTCAGSLESCGSGSSGKPKTAPPFLCRECRTLSQSFDASPFTHVSLNDFISPEEETRLQQFQPDRNSRVADFEWAGIPIGRLMGPYLLRYVRGHRHLISWDNPEILQHVRGMLRLASRYRALLSSSRPGCVVFFNGLFAPESIFLHMSQSQGACTINTERGPKKNTLFLSREAACHYRNSELWISLRDRITNDEIAGARKSVEARARVNLDPSGRPRPVAVQDEAPYEKLAETPYVVFFPPIFHDTASMDKPSPFGDVFSAIDHLCRDAIRFRLKLVIRSHPDEAGETSRNAYRVHDYLEESGYLDSPFIRCLRPEETWNPYLLAARAQAIVIYNGTLGMELPALGYQIYNLAESHYVGKGFTTDLKTKEAVEDIFLRAKLQLTQAERETALRYWHFYYNLTSIEIGTLMDEKKPSQFHLNPRAPAEDSQLVRHQIKERVEFLLNQQLQPPVA